MSGTPLARDAVLLTVDAQRGFDEPAWGQRNNPSLEANLAALHGAWRAAGRPLWHVRHASRKPESSLAATRPGHAFKPEAAPQAGEPVFTKDVHSAFLGTGLGDRLRAAGVRQLVLCGIQTNYCVATTARMAGNLGFDTLVVGDACATFDQRDASGRLWTAQELHDVALMELEGEFARVLRVQDVLGRLG